MSIAIIATIVFGFIAIYALLPRVRPAASPWLGSMAGAGALVVICWAILRPQTATVELVLFYIFSLIAIISGGMLITLRNPVHAALSFALVVLSTCGLFLLQAAPFLMAATIIVYAGAIIVTFLFVIMLAHQEGPSDADQRSREPFLASIAGFFLLGTLLYVLQLNYDTRAIDSLLKRAQRAAAQTSARDIDAALDLPRWQEELVRVTSTSGSERNRHVVSDKLLNVQAHWNDWKEANNVPAMREAVLGLETDLRTHLRESRGSVQPDAHLPLSDFSGLPANVPRSVPQVRYDRTGHVAMPAANLEALGRSVFTDYLLPVEMAGTLLLVATIGAIAIAGRREGLR
jgi:NADH:ubiquinone oxidoreductase subunit 6 (subunit J)